MLSYVASIVARRQMRLASVSGCRVAVVVVGGARKDAAARECAGCRVDVRKRVADVSARTAVILIVKETLFATVGERCVAIAEVGAADQIARPG